MHGSRFYILPVTRVDINTKLQWTAQWHGDPCSMVTSSPICVEFARSLLVPGVPVSTYILVHAGWWVNYPRLHISEVWLQQNQGWGQQVIGSRMEGNQSGNSIDQINL